MRKSEAAKRQKHYQAARRRRRRAYPPRPFVLDEAALYVAPPELRWEVLRPRLSEQGPGDETPEAYR